MEVTKIQMNITTNIYVLVVNLPILIDMYW